MCMSSLNRVKVIGSWWLIILWIMNGLIFVLFSGRSFTFFFFHICQVASPVGPLLSFRQHVPAWFENSAPRRSALQDRSSCLGWGCAFLVPLIQMQNCDLIHWFIAIFIWDWAESMLLQIRNGLLVSISASLPICLPPFICSVTVSQQFYTKPEQ